MNIPAFDFMRITRSIRRLMGGFWDRLKQKGPRFLIVAAIVNPIGMGLSYELYKHFSAVVGIAAISLFSGVMHAAFTYSSHYFFTFGRPGNYLGGLAKMYAGTWLGMLIASGISQILLGTLQMPFFLVQLLMLFFGASYSICVNFLFIYREK